MLSWNRVTEDMDVAIGRDRVYLVIGKPGDVILTRYEWCRPASTEVAAQAARNAIPIHPKAGGDALGSDLGVARKIAQQYEDGESVFGHPPWQHEEDPA